MTGSSGMPYAGAERAHLDGQSAAVGVRADDADLEVAEAPPSPGSSASTACGVARAARRPSRGRCRSTSASTIVGLGRSAARGRSAPRSSASTGPGPHQRRRRERQPVARAGSVTRPAPHSWTTCVAARALPRPRATRARCRASGARRTAARRPGSRSAAGSRRPASVGRSRNVVSDRLVQRANAAICSSVEVVGVVHDGDRVAEQRLGGEDVDLAESHGGQSAAPVSARAGARRLESGQRHDVGALAVRQVAGAQHAGAALPSLPSGVGEPSGRRGR